MIELTQAGMDELQRWYDSLEPRGGATVWMDLIGYDLQLDGTFTISELTQLGIILERGSVVT